MAALTEPLPGTSDLWEPEVREWVFIEESARRVFRGYGYEELRTPIFERTEVFVRSIGDETDVVRKEMYTFEDRGGRSLTLRPEGTAGVIRAIANRGLSQGEQARVFYLGPMFRGERPAAGRRRQFHQIGVEAVGSCTPLQDAETIAMLVDYLAAIGIKDGRVLLNSRGVAEDRPAVAAALTAHFEPAAADMCEDCRRRLHTNVWRILDCKNPACQEIVEKAPRMLDLLSEESQQFFAEACNALDVLEVPYEVAPRLVRGLDYYVHTVFEVVHSGLGAQDALAGGGRYRITLPGGKKAVDGVGFAIGIERLLMARAALGMGTEANKGVDVYVVSLGAEALEPGLVLAQQIRSMDLGLRVIANQAPRSMKAQMRTANRENAGVAVIIGETELANGTCVCKNMKTSEQETVPLDDLPIWMWKRWT